MAALANVAQIRDLLFWLRRHGENVTGSDRNSETQREAERPLTPWVSAVRLLKRWKPVHHDRAHSEVGRTRENSLQQREGRGVGIMLPAGLAVCR